MRLRPFLFATWLLSVLCLASCREAVTVAEEEDRYFTEEPEVVPEARRNGLAEESTAVLRELSTHPVPWVPWSEEVFDYAKREQKIVFALLINAQFSSTQSVLDELAKNPELVRLLQDHYVCTLIDYHAHPEMALVTALLTSEAGQTTALPFFAFITHERNPISWLSLPTSSVPRFGHVLRQAHEMLVDRWQENPRYVVRNSQLNQDDRLKRFQDLLDRVLNPAEEREDEDARRALRTQLQEAGVSTAALYDPITRDVDGSGPLLTLPILRLACALVEDPLLPAFSKKRLTDLISGHTSYLMDTAILDPLDGGVFLGRQTPGWTVPLFVKDGLTQLEAISTLCEIARVTGDSKHLDHANKIFNYLEKRFIDEQGNLRHYYPAAPRETLNDAHLWSTDELAEVLAEEEFSVVEAHYGIVARGNIPEEADPKRRHFRLNRLRPVKDLAAVADELNISLEQARTLLDSAHQRMLVHRAELLGEGDTEPSFAPVGIQVRLSTTLVDLGVATERPELLERARTLLEAIKQEHAEAERLMRIPSTHGRRGVTARGIDYATLLEAVWRLYQEDFDPQLLVWAHRLTTEILTYLKLDTGILTEAPAGDTILPIPITGDLRMLGQSTWCTLFASLARLNACVDSADLQEVIDTKITFLGPALQKQPVGYSEFGAGALVFLHDLTICLDGPDGEALDEMHALLRKPSYRSTTVIRLDQELPAEFVFPPRSDTARALIYQNGEVVGEASGAEELATMLATLSQPE